MGTTSSLWSPRLLIAPHDCAHSARVLTGRRELQCPQAARRHVHHRSEGRVSEPGDSLCPAHRRTGRLTSQQRWPRALANSHLHHSFSKLCFGPLRKPTTQPTSCVAMPDGSGSQVPRGPCTQPRSSAAGLLRAVRKPGAWWVLNRRMPHPAFSNAFTHRPFPISETSVWNDSRLSGSCRNSPERS